MYTRPARNSFSGIEVSELPSWEWPRSGFGVWLHTAETTWYNQIGSWLPFSKYAIIFPLALSPNPPLSTRSFLESSIPISLLVHLHYLPGFLKVIKTHQGNYFDIDVQTTWARSLESGVIRWWCWPGHFELAPLRSQWKCRVLSLITGNTYWRYWLSLNERTPWPSRGKKARPFRHFTNISASQKAYLSWSRAPDGCKTYNWDQSSSETLRTGKTSSRYQRP